MSSELFREVLQGYPEPLQSADAWLEPFDWYRRMRAENPVRYDTARDTYDVFRYDDVKRVLNDAETFSSDPRKTPGDNSDHGTSPMRETMISTDPPRHTRLRGITSDFFEPDAVADKEPRIRELAMELLDDAVAGGECDFVADFARPFPVRVVAELFGIPAEDRDRFARWTAAIVEMMSGNYSPQEVRERYDGTMAEMTAYFGEALEERRENPRDDLLSAIATGEFEGEGLDVREMLGYCMLIMLGGTLTTTNLLTNALRCLADDPDLLRAYEAGDRAASDLIEETLRYRSPLQALSRYANEPVEFRGHEIDEGELLVLWVGSANRDERRFDAPSEFRPGRSPNPHLAFGSGIHYCLGASLARLDTEIALTELFERLSGIEVETEDLTPKLERNKFVHGVESLPISFETTG